MFYSLLIIVDCVLLVIYQRNIFNLLSVLFIFLCYILFCIIPDFDFYQFLLKNKVCERVTSYLASFTSLVHSVKLFIIYRKRQVNKYTVLYEKSSQ